MKTNTVIQTALLALCVLATCGDSCTVAPNAGTPAGGGSQ